MTEQLSPEQRAERLYRSLVNADCQLSGYDIKHKALMAQAFRAAVEAERARCAKVADEWHEWYEKPGSGTRHALRIAHHIRNPDAETSHDR